ncbi:beta subunit of fatty acid synthetase [Lecanora helva]
MESSNQYLSRPSHRGEPGGPPNGDMQQSQNSPSEASKLSISWKSATHTLPLSNDAHFCLSTAYREFEEHVLVSMEDPSAPFHILEVLVLFLDYLCQAFSTKTCHELSNHRGFVREVLGTVEEDLVANGDIHNVVTAIDISIERKKAVLAGYYNAIAYSAHKPRVNEPRLWKALGGEKPGICAIFTGQGNTNADALNDLRELWWTYNPLIRDLVSSASKSLLTLSKSVDAASFYQRNCLDLRRWLENEDSSPDPEYLASAPISFPMVGLLNLANFCIMCKVAGISPGRAVEVMQAVTGHSQGVVVAACVAKVKTWEDFSVATQLCLKVLFWIGLYAHEASPRSTLSAQQIQDHRDHNENTPSPMLSIIGLSYQEIDSLVVNANKHLPTEQKVSIALINMRKNVVLSGSAKSLRGIVLHIRTLKNVGDVDQSRTPYNQRKPDISVQFLPISAPFHSKHLSNATERILDRLGSFTLLGRELNTAVICTETGENLCEKGDKNIIPSLVKMVTCQLVDWPTASAFPGATHIIEFGPGSFSNLLSQMKEGTCTRIIAAGSVRPSDSSIGSKSELFDARCPPPLSQSWEQEFGPRLTYDKALVETKFSKLLGMPPILVAGMTPTTVPYDFVTAVSNAGFYVELAGGGYFNKEAFRQAILNVVSNTRPGRGLAVNLIYANPRAIAWQVPLIAQLIREGISIDGITIGAGVPSPEVAHDYITNIGLKYIGFKPGSVDSIRQVIDIAKRHPAFPIIMQWTGGRGGGHHSFEDFHSPMLQMYGRIRKCSNIILVAGSGFGDAEDSYPYLTGTWADNFGYPPMPFDGILLGSRMMVAKEAHTSLQAKMAIVETEGVPDIRWVGSYERETGGVITVLSEMGQPIHKLATRGVLLWSELDKIIFNSTGPKRLAALKANKEWIIEKLNSDSAKVWFPTISSGETAELEDMTYQEVLSRLIELMYVARQSRWIDPSYEGVVINFIHRTHERFAVPQSDYDLSRPFDVADQVAQKIPECRSQLVSPDDANFFVSICRRSGQKPVNFVPRLDDDFEYYFKKDSLWQSEDVDAVVDQDVGRVCILQGPVAAHYSKTINEPAGDILSSINKAFIRKLTEIPSSEHLDDIQTSRVFAGVDKSDVHNVQVKTLEEGIQLSLGTSGNLPDPHAWWSMIASRTSGWVSKIFKAEHVLQGRIKVVNPVRTFFAPKHGLVLIIDMAVKGDYQVTLMNLDSSDKAYRPSARITSVDGLTLLADIFEHRTRGQNPAVLSLRFQYNPIARESPISEVMHGRNDRIKSFYSTLWFGERLLSDVTPQSTFVGNPVTLTEPSVSQFLRSIGDTSLIVTGADRPEVPMDAAILASWEVLMKPLLCPAIDGDLLKLVHRSNNFKYVKGASPLRLGDVVNATSTVKGVYIEESGKVVEVSAIIIRDGKPVMRVLSTFLFQGSYEDFENTYKIVREPTFMITVQSAKIESLLYDREWLILDPGPTDLIGKHLKFTQESRYGYAGKNVIKSLDVSGTISIVTNSGSLQLVGLTDLSVGRCSRNPVMEFLERWGAPTEKVIQLQNPLHIDGNEDLMFDAPLSNELYGRVSGDYNPIHVSEHFATYANLPGTVTHGMYTSAVVRSMAEKWMADGVSNRFKSWKASFVGMVLPGDKLRVSMSHVGSVKGRKVVKVTTANETSGAAVLNGEAEVEEPRTAYMFTGQGSQSKGMGMDMYASSARAREVWDEADKHMLENYGWSPLQIVRDNPKTLTIHFGGKRGRRIRDNYLSMKIERTSSDGKTNLQPLLGDIKPNSTSYTFTHPSGLLFLTQFAQPTLTLLERANFADMKAKGIIQEDARFAGHSLGEFGALGSVTDFMPIEKFVSLSFYRGLTMSLVMERDEFGRTEYSMMAVNPSKVMKGPYPRKPILRYEVANQGRLGIGFDETALKHVVNTIAQESGLLLEIVNYNIEGQQYVCAGHLTTLHILSTLLSQLPLATTSPSSPPSPPTETTLNSLLTPLLSTIPTLPYPITLTRTPSCVPLSGIDIPFHSSLLRPSVPAFRTFLQKQINAEDVVPEQLVGRYVPNLMAGEVKGGSGDGEGAVGNGDGDGNGNGVFELSKEYVESVARVTGSEVLADVLRQWSEYDPSLEESRAMDLEVSQEITVV